MLYLFDIKQTLIDELPSSFLVSAVQEENLNGVTKFTFEIYNNYYDRMKDIEYVAHKDMEDQSKIQMYRIITSAVGETSTTYDCIHVLFDDLSSYGYLKHIRLEEVKASVALDHVLKDTKWEQGLTSDSVLKSINFYDIDKLTGLYDIINTWGMELQFSIGFSGNQITSRKVWLETKTGNYTGERFVYGDKALEVVQEIDKANICTRIVPRGKRITDTQAYKESVENQKKTDDIELEAERDEQRQSREEEDELKAIREAVPYETRGRTPIPSRVEDEDAYVPKVEITDLEWTPTEEIPISKPMGQEYIELVEMTEKLGYPDGTPRVKVVEFSDIEDPNYLLSSAYKRLVELCRPLVEYKTKVTKKSRTHIGDTVVVIRRELDIFYTTRIFKVQRDILKGSYEIEFGDEIRGAHIDSKPTITVEDLKKENDLQRDFIRDIQDQLHAQAFNQDGYNYELRADNEYGLPGGYYSFDRAIDDNPTKVIYVGGGMIAIANSKKIDGTWDWRSFGTGDGFVADLIIAGMIRGGKVKWNLEDGTFLIGDSVDDYSMYWDGGTLHFRNVDIDISTNSEIKNLKNSLGDKLSKDDILGDLEIQESLKGDDGETPKIIDGMWVIGDTATDVRAEGKDALNLRAFAKDITDNGKTIIGFCLEEEKEETYPWIGSFNPRWNVDKSDMDTLRNDPKNYIWTRQNPKQVDLEIDSIKDIASNVKKDTEEVQGQLVEINATVGGLNTEQQKALKKLQETLTSIEQIQLSENARDEEIQATNELINYVNTQISSVEEGIANGSLNIDNLTEMLDSYIQNLPEEIQKKIESDEYLIKLKKSVVIDSKGISIGQEGSRYGINLDNEALRFYNSSSEVAYINSSRLYIQEAEILSSLKIFYLLARKHISNEGEKFVYFNWVND